MTNTIEVYKRVNGSIVIGDAEDDAPLIVVEFHNEMQKLTDTQKFALVWDIAEKLSAM